MHPAAYKFMQDALRESSPLRPGLTVEIGGRDINGSVRDLFPAPYISVDIRPGVGVDVVADGATWTPPAPAVRVVCCEVLEHTPSASRLVYQAWRMLGYAGVCYLTAAGPSRAPHSAIDGGAVRPWEFYRGVSADLLVAWLEPFERRAVVEDEDAGDIYAIAWK